MIRNLPFLILLGCTGQGSNLMDYWDCTRTKVPVTEVPPPVSESMVWSAIEEFAPTKVSWDEFSPIGHGRSRLAWSIARGDGDAETVEYGGTDAECTVDTGLAIPVVVKIDIGDGMATQTLATDLEAWGPTPADIDIYEPDSLEDEVRVTLDDSWADVCSTNEAGQWRGGLDEAYLFYEGTFQRMGIDIEGENETTAGECFSGVLGARRDSIEGVGGEGGDTGTPDDGS